MKISSIDVQKKERIVEFPKYRKSLWGSIGPAIVLIGLGIGSGEFILWPFLSANYGFGVMWGALLGITLQLFLILEIQRYTVVSGENIIQGFSRLWKYLPVWVIVSTLIGFGWPGFAAIAAKLLVGGFGLPESFFMPVAIGILLLSVVVLLLSRSAYKKLVFLQKINIGFLFSFILFLFVYYFNLNDFVAMLKGIVGIGDGYLFYPASLGVGLFLGALAYAGSGGNLLLGNSFYAIEEGQGLSKKSSKFLLWQKHKKGDLSLETEEDVYRDIASQSSKSMENFKSLRKIQIWRNTLIFWLLGFVTILLLSYISKVVLSGVVFADDFSFLIIEAGIFSSDIGKVAGVLFLASGVFSLSLLQMGIFDFMGRSTAVSVQAMQLKKNIKQNKIYAYAVLGQALFGIIVFAIGLSQPKSLIMLGAIINAVVMGFLAVFLIILNKKFLPKGYRISLFQKVVLAFAAVIYFGLFIVTIVEKIF